MEAIKKIVRIPKNHVISIRIPQYVPENEIMEVILIIKKRPDSFKQKIEELKEAIMDNLFLDDLRDISEDFKTVDLEVQEGIIDALCFQLVSKSTISCFFCTPACHLSGREIVTL